MTASPAFYDTPFDRDASDAELPEYEVFAVRYATRGSTRGKNFLGGDAHDGPMDMDYFVWLVRGAERTFVVDTGFNAEVAARRGRTLLRTPAEGLALLGVDAAMVHDVIVTHLHYDHVGTFADFPVAQFHLQDAEMAYATGRHMCHRQFNHGYEVDEVCGMVRLVYQDRVTFHDGDVRLAPGVSLHRTGGHTDGLQCVRVHTRRGWVVLASDVSHYYEHFQHDRVFTTCFSVGDAVAAYRTLRSLAQGDESRIVPGHDPQVMQRYPAPSPDLAGIAVRLDVPPVDGA